MDIDDWSKWANFHHDGDQGNAIPSQLHEDGEINIVDAESPASIRLLKEVRDKNEDAVRHLLDEGANLATKTEDGVSPLHLAISNHDISMIQLLIEKGADLEAESPNGCKPLYTAVQSSNIEMVELLLKFNPNVEALNPKSGKTAFQQAILEDGNTAIAELLLDNRADIDARLPNGYTALFSAVEKEKLDIVNFLLRHGANKKIKLENGQTVLDLAEGDNAMTQLLESSQLLEGPSITNQTTNPDMRFIYTPSLPADNIDKVYACRGFEATIIDFFGGDRERRIQVSSPIYDILYGKGPEAIVSSLTPKQTFRLIRYNRWHHHEGIR